MRSDEEFIKGIYEKAAAIQNLSVQNEPKRHRFSIQRLSTLAAAACICLLVAGVAVSGGRLFGNSNTDGEDGISSSDYALNEENVSSYSRAAENEDANAGIATMSLGEQSYVHGVVQEVVQISGATSGFTAYVNLKLSENGESMTVYIADAAGWDVGEEVWLLVELDEAGAYLLNSTDKYELDEDGAFYNEAGVVFGDSKMN